MKMEFCVHVDVLLANDSYFYFCENKEHSQWWIQDFPEGGCANSQKDYYFSFFFAENCMKMKEFGPRGGARIPGAPPWVRQGPLVGTHPN